MSYSAWTTVNLPITFTSKSYTVSTGLTALEGTQTYAYGSSSPAAVDYKESTVSRIKHGVNGLGAGLNTAHFIVIGH